MQAVRPATHEALGVRIVGPRMSYVPSKAKSLASPRRRDCAWGRITFLGCVGYAKVRLYDERRSQ